MPIRLDHFVLTVTSIEATCAFYREVLDATVVRFGEGRVALDFGGWKINLHPAGHELEPKAARPTPGGADFCVTTAEPLHGVIARLRATGHAIEAGPVPRTGARGAILSIYLRDPDGNLLEIANEA